VPGQVFFSYVHTDDDNDLGSIVRLAALLQKELSLLTGEARSVWIDRTSLGWGADWKQRIEEALYDTTFFVPIVTPAYFRSDSCRDELMTFARSASSLGLNELVLPIYYVTVDGFDEEIIDDEAVTLVHRFQYIDWRSLRVTSHRTTAFRRKLNELAAQILAAGFEAESKTVPLPATPLVPSPPTPGEPSEEEPGIGDILAEGEEALQRIAPQFEQAGNLGVQIGTLMQEATHSINRSDAQGRGFAGRLVVSRSLATKLEQPAEDLERVARAFAADLVRVDPMITTIFNHLSHNASERAQSREFLENIVTMVSQAKQGFSATGAFADSVHEGMNWSKELRRPLRRIETALRQIADAERVFDEWGNRAAVLLNQPPEDPPDAAEPEATP